MINGELQVQEDHVEGLATIRNPIVGVEELIWNSLDADSNSVTIKTTTNDLGGLSTIVISDDGLGIPFSEYQRAFGSLGGSNKKVIPTTPSGRVHHGKLGKGRFKGLGIGALITWQSRYQAGEVVNQFDVTVRKSALRRFDVSEEKAVRGNRTGVTATIKGIDGRHPSLLDSENVADELARRLALYLKKYPGIEITYDGHSVDPRKLESHTESYEIMVPDTDGEDFPAEVTVIEWNTPTDRALYFCDKDGFALEESRPGIKAPGFHFTAYVKSDVIPQLVEEGAFGVEGLHPRVQSIHRTAKELLRGHFRKREAARAKDFVEQWRQDGVYPYNANEVDPLKTAEKEVFDICATKVQTYLKQFEKSDVQNKRLTFRLIREALESNPDSLQKILRQVLELPQDQQDELASLLERTKLGAIINAAKTVVDRLDFIASLDAMLFGQFKQKLLERKQLHRILVQELWIFGEQYALGNDDESLAKVLEKHLSLLGQNKWTAEELELVRDLDDKQRIIDLMLHRQIPQLQPNTFEHLVVELKRPSCKLGKDELSQIENYAMTVAEDERFDKSQTRWTFVLVGNELSPFAERRCRQQGRQWGNIYTSEDNSVNVWVKKWSTFLQEAKWRYEFFRKKLEIAVTTSDGLQYLQRYKDLLPGSTNSPTEAEEP